ncbi:MAG: sulfite exporter TauE/SafE family protein [Candidatus Omnitrophica bacterium]|nr:sulfite exporter TauE/SafE family protein [Candidatus Omnitrophota bacterium]
MFYFLIAAIGFLGGLTSGLFGVGGGLMFVPLLILFRHFDPHRAIGTSLVVIIPTAIAGSIRHHLAAMIDWPTVFWLMLFAILGAWFGASLSVKVNILLLRRLFALLMVVISLRLFFEK